MDGKRASNKVWAAAIAAATTLATPTSSIASSHPSIDTDVLCSESGLVLEGTVASVVNTFPLLPMEPGGTAMAATTRVTLTVHTTFKGSVVANKAVMRLPGGKLPNGDIQQWAGTPSLDVGDRVIVFATNEGSPAMLNLTAFSNGVLTQTTLDGTLVPLDGQGSFVGSWPTSGVPTLWSEITEASTAVDDEDTNLAGADVVTTNDTVTVLTTNPVMPWATLISSVTNACATVTTPEQAAQSIDHTSL